MQRRFQCEGTLQSGPRLGYKIVCLGILLQALIRLNELPLLQPGLGEVMEITPSPQKTSERIGNEIGGSRVTRRRESLEDLDRKTNKKSKEGDIEKGSVAANQPGKECGKATAKRHESQNIDREIAEISATQSKLSPERHEKTIAKKEEVRGQHKVRADPSGIVHDASVLFVEQIKSVRKVCHPGKLVAIRCPD